MLVPLRLGPPCRPGLWDRERHCCVNNVISLPKRQSAGLAARTAISKVKKKTNNNLARKKKSSESYEQVGFYYSRILGVIIIIIFCLAQTPLSSRPESMEVISKGRGERSASVFKLKFVPGETERMPFPQRET